MKKNSVSFFFLLLITFINCDYFDGEEISSTSTTGSDTVPDLEKNSKSKISAYLNQKCFCDFLADVCEEYCCCDNDCSSSQTQEWEKNNRCLKDIQATDYGEHCINKYLFSYEGRDTPIPGYIKTEDKYQYCYKADKADEFQSNIKLIRTVEHKAKGDISNFIKNKLVDIATNLKNKDISDNLSAQSSVVSTSYDPSLSSQLIYSSGVDAFNLNNAFVVYRPDFNGMCLKGKGVAPFQNIEPKTCLMKVEDMNRNGDFSLSKIEQNLKIGNKKVVFDKANSYIYNNHVIKTITNETTADLSNFFPAELEFNIFIDKNSEFCASFRAIVVSNGVVGAGLVPIKISVNFNSFDSTTTTTCQNFAAQFSTVKLSVPFSGNPGYDIGTPLRVVSSENNGNEGSTENSIYMNRYGATSNPIYYDANNECQTDKNANTYNLLYSKPLLFGVNSYLSCTIKKVTGSSIIEDIIKNSPFILKLKNMMAIGGYGNAFIPSSGYTTDKFAKIKFDGEELNLDEYFNNKINSTTEDGVTYFYYPGKITVYIFYSNVGETYNPQLIVHSVKFSTSTEKIQTGKDVILTFSFQYVRLDESMYQESEYPRFMPPLPMDLAKVINTEEMQ